MVMSNREPADASARKRLKRKRKRKLAIVVIGMFAASSALGLGTTPILSELRERLTELFSTDANAESAPVAEGSGRFADGREAPTGVRGSLREAVNRAAAFVTGSGRSERAAGAVAQTVRGERPTLDTASASESVEPLAGAARAAHRDRVRAAAGICAAAASASKGAGANSAKASGLRRACAALGGSVVGGGGGGGGGGVGGLLGLLRRQGIGLADLPLEELVEELAELLSVEAVAGMLADVSMITGGLPGELTEILGAEAAVLEPLLARSTVAGFVDSRTRVMENADVHTSLDFRTRAAGQEFGTGPVRMSLQPGSSTPEGVGVEAGSGKALPVKVGPIAVRVDGERTTLRASEALGLRVPPGSEPGGPDPDLGGVGVRPGRKVDRTTGESKSAVSRTAEESRSTLSRTAGGSKSALSRTAEESKSSLTRKTGKSKSMLSRTAEESKSTLTRKAGKSKSALSRTTEESKSSLTRKTGKSKSMLSRTAEESKSSLTRKTGKSKSMLSRTAEESKSTLTRKTGKSKSMLSRSAEESKSTLSRKTGKSKSALTRTAEESKSTLTRKAGKSKSALTRTAEESKSTLSRKTEKAKAVLPRTPGKPRKGIRLDAGLAQGEAVETGLAGKRVRASEGAAAGVGATVDRRGIGARAGAAQGAQARALSHGREVLGVGEKAGGGLGVRVGREGIQPSAHGAAAAALRKDSERHGAGLAVGHARPGDGATGGKPPPPAKIPLIGAKKLGDFRRVVGHVEEHGADPGKGAARPGIPHGAAAGNEDAIAGSDPGGFVDAVPDGGGWTGEALGAADGALGAADGALGAADGALGAADGALGGILGGGDAGGEAPIQIETGGGILPPLQLP